MILYRIAKEAFKDDLSGTGAELGGGRWNHKGTAILYTSASRALCMAEAAVHIPLGIIPPLFYMLCIEIPDNVQIKAVQLSQLPDDWKRFPYINATQKIGDDFVAEGKSFVLKAPSAVVPGDYNYLINPGHPLAKQIIIKECTPFQFDQRLFVRK